MMTIHDEHIRQTKDLLQAESLTVSMWFVKRDKDKTKESTYTLFEVPIENEVKKAFVEGAKAQFEDLGEDTEFVQYDDKAIVGKNRVGYEAFSKVRHLREVVSSLAQPASNFSKEATTEWWGYVVEIKSVEQSLCLFNKYVNTSLPLEKIAVRFIGKKLKKVEAPFVLSTYFHAAILFSESYNAATLPVYIFNLAKFELLFSYYDSYKANIERQKDAIGSQLCIENPEKFVDECLKNKLKIKTMNNMLKYSKLISLGSKQIKSINKAYNLKLKFNEKGKIVADAQNAWKILHLYNDDCVASAYTRNKYIAIQKDKIEN
jgi:Domain of unknown function (DUF4868)